MRLVLASASPARLTTLTAAGFAPQVHVSGVDEDAVLAAAHARRGPGAAGAADDVVVLARAKAEAVAQELVRPHAAAAELVLGCDSLLELDGESHGKPADAAQAVARWRRMRGRTGVLHTGHWLVDLRTGRGVGRAASTVVHFADLSDAEVDAYVGTGEPLAVAGAFTVDGIGGPFVTGIEGDYHTVVGVSLPLLRDLLAEVGVSVVDLWAPPA